MNIKKLPIGKIITVILVLAFIAVCIASFLSERREKLENALNDSNSRRYGFYFDGTIYSRNYSDGYTFLRKLGDEENYIFLPGYTHDWSDSIEKFVYSDGKKIKTCDINVKNTETLHKFSGERTVILSDFLGKYALIEGVMLDGNGHQPIGSTYILNLETGDAIETEMRTKLLNAPLAISGNYLYYFACYITEPRNDLCRCDITTGKCETLISELSNDIEWQYGCIIDDYLYFSYDPNYSKKGIARYSLSTGELEASNPGVSIRYLSEYKGKLLTAYYTQAEDGKNLIIHVCTYDFDSQELEEIGSSKISSSFASDIRIYDGFLVVSANQVFLVNLSM